MIIMLKILSLLCISLHLFAATPEFQTGFPLNVPNSQRTFAGSPALADLNNDNLPEIIFGNRSGIVYAYRSNGVLLWSHDTGTVSIESKPAVADMDGDGNVEVIVTAGSTQVPGIGSLSVLNGQTGVEICRYTPAIFGGGTSGVYGSAAIANLDGDPQLEMAFGDWGAKVSVLNHDCSVVWQSQSPPAVTGTQLPPNFDETVPPFTAYVNDTVWSSPAIADINGDGQLDVIIGVDSHIDDNNLTVDGGRLLVINGNNGTVQMAIDTDEVVWSSPAIADINNDGEMDIVFATGFCWQSTINNCAPPPNGQHNVVNKIFAVDKNGNDLPGWPHILEANHAVRVNSVAIGDIDNDGFLEVVINTFDYTTPTSPFNGQVFAIEHTGQKKWGTIPNVPAGQTNFTHFAAGSASPIIVDITGNGSLDVVVPSNWELVVYDKNGVQISRQDPNSGPNDLTLLGNFPFLSTPSVADIDNDGDLELVAIGGTVAITPRPSTIWVWDLTTPSSEFQPWTSFRNDIKNTGNFRADLIYANGFE